jgi:hypothetical protein
MERFYFKRIALVGVKKIKKKPRFPGAIVFLKKTGLD